MAFYAKQNTYAWRSAYIKHCNDNRIQNIGALSILFTIPLTRSLPFSFSLSVSHSLSRLLLLLLLLLSFSHSPSHSNAFCISSVHCTKDHKRKLQWTVTWMRRHVFENMVSCTHLLTNIQNWAVCGELNICMCTTRCNPVCRKKNSVLFGVVRFFRKTWQNWLELGKCGK